MRRLRAPKTVNSFYFHSDGFSCRSIPIGFAQWRRLRRAPKIIDRMWARKISPNAEHFRSTPENNKFRLDEFSGLFFSFVTMRSLVERARARTLRNSYVFCVHQKRKNTHFCVDVVISSSSHKYLFVDSLVHAHIRANAAEFQQIFLFCSVVRCSHRRTHFDFGVLR